MTTNSVVHSLAVVGDGHGWAVVVPDSVWLSHIYLGERGLAVHCLGRPWLDCGSFS